MNESFQLLHDTGKKIKARFHKVIKTIKNLEFTMHQRWASSEMPAKHQEHIFVAYIWMFCQFDEYFCCWLNMMTGRAATGIETSHERLLMSISAKSCSPISSVWSCSIHDQDIAAMVRYIQPHSCREYWRLTSLINSITDII